MLKVSPAVWSARGGACQHSLVTRMVSCTESCCAYPAAGAGANVESKKQEERLREVLGISFQCSPRSSPERGLSPCAAQWYVQYAPAPMHF